MIDQRKEYIAEHRDYRSNWMKKKIKKLFCRLIVQVVLYLNKKEMEKK